MELLLFSHIFYSVVMEKSKFLHPSVGISVIRSSSFLINGEVTSILIRVTSGKSIPRNSYGCFRIVLEHLWTGHVFKVYSLYTSPSRRYPFPPWNLPINGIPGYYSPDGYPHGILDTYPICQKSMLRPRLQNKTHIENISEL